MIIKAFLALLVVSCTLSQALAQTTPNPQTPTTPAPSPQKPADDQDDVVKITTNLVQIDAVVTKDGRHVPNLTADDFEIFEDGRKQTITSFAYISNLKDNPAPPPVKNAKNEVVPFGPINPADARRTVALVVDDLGLSFESMARVRGQLRKFISEKTQPNDLIAIIRTGGEVGALQQFTNDRRVLTRAVDMLRWNPCSRMGVHTFAPARGSIRTNDQIQFCGFHSILQTLKSLRFITEAMGRLPGRKSLVIFSDSMPRQSQDQFELERGGLADEGIVESMTSPLSTDYANLTAFLQSIAERAIRGSVVIYSVDTQGLAIVDLTAADVIRGATPQEIHNRTQVLRMRRMDALLTRREGGELIAKQTGGFQVRNSNSLELDRIMDDQSGYYLIGYRPTEETFNRRFHHIKAKLKRGGMSVRTRYGFYGVTEEDMKKAQPTPRDMTNLALASPYRAQDLEIEMTSFFADEPQVGLLVRSFVYLDINELQFETVDGKHQGSFEIHGVLFGDNGSIVEQMKRGATINLTDAELQNAKKNRMGLGINMPVKRHGSYQVRLVVRDRKSQKIGSAGQYVVVPNLKEKKLAVSGMVLGTLDQASAQKESEQSILNPGSRRVAPNSSLYFGYRLYNGTVPNAAQLRNVVMQAKIFSDGKSVYSGEEIPISAGSQQDLNRLFVEGTVKLTPELQPGIYYLQVMITDKGAKKEVPVVQWADFEIVK